MKGFMENKNMNTKEETILALPTGEQLTILLENLFDRSRLAELAHRCNVNNQDVFLRQARIEELIESLVKAWEIGPKRPRGSLWGTIDLELSSRLRNYLGLGEQKLREMLDSLQAEGAYDRKTAATLLWVLLHERWLSLLSEYESILGYRYRDTGTVLPKKAEETGKLEKILERIEDLSREIKALVNSQSREIEDIARRLEKLEKLPNAKIDENQSRRLRQIPREQIRVGVFVDVQNMFYAAKKLDGARLNYEVMLDTILAGRRLIKAVAYIVEASEIDQSGFISVLEKKGYQVRRKGLKSFGDGTAKGDWDMGMAIDMIEIAGQLDVVVLVSGDGDFVSLVSLIKKTGPRVELYAFGHNLSTELREVSDQFYEISSDLLLKNHHQQNITSTTESKNNNLEKLPGEFVEEPPEKNKGKQ
jgi:uncharacterized LabA/DUF88 family protein